MPASSSQVTEVASEERKRGMESGIRHTVKLAFSLFGEKSYQVAHMKEQSCALCHSRIFPEGGGFD